MINHLVSKNHKTLPLTHLFSHESINLLSLLTLITSQLLGQQLQVVAFVSNLVLIILKSNGFSIPELSANIAVPKAPIKCQFSSTNMPLPISSSNDFFTPLFLLTPP